MPVKQEQHAKPVQLQVNNSGAWKTIAQFDAADVAATELAQSSARWLRIIDKGLKFRIATRDSLPVVLMRLDDDLEWSPA